jgi:hypothetical protein
MVAVCVGGIMREEIRLGNAALERHDLDEAKHHFQQLLANGGTPTQERIAANRLREIQEKQNALLAPPPTKTRAPRKAARSSESNEAVKRTFVRPPDHPVVEIKKY